MKTPCQLDPEMWVSDLAESRREAAKACAHCPVLEECRAESLTIWPEHGVWGGVDWSRYDAVNGTPRTIPREKVPTRPITHGTYGGYRAHRRRGEAACEVCRLAQNAYERGRKARKDAAA